MNNYTPKYHEKDPEYNIRAYFDYMNGVLDGSIVANEYIKLACKRMKDWFSRDDIYFDVDDVDSRINFVWKLRHTEAPWTGKHFKLSPWQQFCIANIYGWKKKETGYRLTRKAFIMISRKNGKTSLAAALCLCNIICDKEQGAQINLVANNSKQASQCYEYMVNYANSIDPRKKVFQTYRSEIRVPLLKSKIQTLCADSMGLDGYNSSLVVYDELHASRDWKLYDVMKTSMGSRPQGLMIVITTAGTLVGDSYPCYSTWQTCIDILRGVKKDDTQFSAIYQLDPDDDWEDEKVWLKCCPGLGDSVFPDAVREELTSALNNRSREVGVRTKIFNQWCESDNVWLEYDYIVNSMKQMSLEDMANLPNVSYAYVGVDLSSVRDLTAVTVMVKSLGKYYFKSWAFVPEKQLESGRLADKYKTFKNSGHLIVTEGNVQDHARVLKLIQDIDKVITVAGVYYDTWNALWFAVNATNAGLPLYPYSQALGNFNGATKSFELELLQGNVVIDYSPLVLWCFTTCALMFDHNGNCKPVKADEHNSKIDPIITMLEALGGFYLDNNITPPALTAI